MVSIEDRLAALATMSPTQLRDQWQAAAKGPVPRVSADMLRLALAWTIQAGVCGGLSPATRRRLKQAAQGKVGTMVTPPGTRLAREWNGTIHIVSVNEQGNFIWNNRAWGSLSEVARAITGTRWSGPRFFGLEQRMTAA